MWSEETKQGLLRHNPQMFLMDAFSSSEALGMGQSVSGGGQAAKTAKFEPGLNNIVVRDDDQRITEPRVTGRLAVGGRQPLGQYKAHTKSDRKSVVQGKRW